MVSHVVVKNVLPIESFRAVGTLEVLKHTVMIKFPEALFCSTFLEPIVEQNQARFSR